MNSTASKNEMNVEASHSQSPTLPLATIPGTLRPWKARGSLTVGAIAKFRPATPDAWIEGASFCHSPKSGPTFVLVVVRYIPAQEVPASSDLVKIGHSAFWKHYPARTVPELVVVRITSVEARR